MYRSIQQFIENLDITKISEDRKINLEDFIGFIAQKLKSKETVNLNFICTHNSRRSHFSQIWAQTIAEFLGIKTIKSYSGGTEATAVYPSVLKAFQSVGFSLGRLSENE
ncbi:MAG TPA: protein-tyrosine-phosphatase, partial [Zunongwangia profunda]|nr:protein-tyrosine-phosphatase [Zunongwangia profunda]